MEKTKKKEGGEWQDRPQAHTHFQPPSHATVKHQIFQIVRKYEKGQKKKMVFLLLVVYLCGVTCHDDEID
tara:strand:- start:527 stop:736 length:210 start_codon:yes stop_codon:yes gene_type:complete